MLAMAWLREGYMDSLQLAESRFAKLLSNHYQDELWKLSGHLVYPANVSSCIEIVQRCCYAGYCTYCEILTISTWFV